MPFVASEKKVDACVVSTVFDQVYDDCADSPFSQRRRTSTISALYQEFPSLLLSSIVENARLGRGVPAGGKSRRPSGCTVGAGMFTSPLRNRCTPRDAAKPSVASALPGINRCTLTLPMCRRGFSRFHWTGRIELPTPRSNGGVGNVGLAITNRGVAGGFVTVTIRFC